MERLWAGWRSEYVAGATKPEKPSACVFCSLLASKDGGKDTGVVWRGPNAAAVLNAFPYGTGHLLIMPVRHVGELEELSEDESQAVWRTTRDAVAAIKAAYGPDGVNAGMNLGAAAGAGIPGHLHMHALPRWSADTNFMSAVANARVLPEALEITWSKLTNAWPA